MNWLDALATRLGTKPARKAPRRFKPSLESLDRRDVPALVGPTSSICGYAYVDANNDGIFQSTETPISGVVVNLNGTDAWGQAVSLSTTTGADGSYCFTQDEYGAALLPGTYTVTEVQPAGYIDGKDTAGTPASGTTGNDTFVDVNLGTTTVGVNAVNYNFGERLPDPKNSSLCGYVYVDADNDGVKDAGEAGIGGVMVTLAGSDANGPVTQTVFTDATGEYCFLNLGAGTYTVTETQPAGFLDGKDTQGTPGTGTVGNDVFSNITLSTGVNGKNNNFGEQVAPPPKSSLCGYVYVDADNDGVKDAGEAGISGVKVTLTGTDANGSVTRTAYTDASGEYCFLDLLAGTYKLTETQPAGFNDGKDTQGSPGTGTVSNDMFSNITLAAGVNGKNNNFGEIKPPKLADICGTVYYDANKNGVLDSGDRGIQGVKVVLTGPNGVTRTAYTDYNGKYCFDDLVAGTYKLTEYQPSGYNQGVNKAGNLGGSVSGDVISGINVNGTDGTGYNFGEKVAYGCVPPKYTLGCWY